MVRLDRWPPNCLQISPEQRSPTAVVPWPEATLAELRWGRLEPFGYDFQILLGKGIAIGAHQSMVSPIRAAVNGAALGGGQSALVSLMLESRGVGTALASVMPKRCSILEMYSC